MQDELLKSSEIWIARAKCGEYWLYLDQHRSTSSIGEVMSSIVAECSPMEQTFTKVMAARGWQIVKVTTELRMNGLRSDLFATTKTEVAYGG